MHVDPDQMLQNVASDLGLHSFLPIKQFLTHQLAGILTQRAYIGNGEIQWFILQKSGGGGGGGSRERAML